MKPTQWFIQEIKYYIINVIKFYHTGQANCNHGGKSGGGQLAQIPNFPWNLMSHSPGDDITHETNSMIHTRNKILHNKCNKILPYWPG